MNAKIIAGMLAVAVAGCGGGGAHNKSALGAYKTNKGKVAVVSITVNDYADVLKNNNVSSADVNAVIDKKMVEMLTLAETKLGGHFSVMPAAEFSAKDDYQKLSSGQAFDVFRPAVDGKPMPIFAESRSDLIKSNMTPDRAKQLCTTLGVDMVAVVYSEWQTKTGGIVPTTKPYTKTVLSIFDKSGEQLYGNRHDETGAKNVGAFGVSGVTEENISHWVNAYDKALQFMVDGL
jgi:hypothetical protein